MLLKTILALVTSLEVTAHAQVPVVRIDGSSTVFPITEAMAEDFQTSVRGKVRVTVGVSGTGGGFKKFCRGETDVQDASRPIQEKELQACKDKGIKFIEIPIAFDAAAIAVHPKNTWLNQITLAELKKIWSPEAQGKIKKWSDVNPAWPNEKMNLYGPGSDSGTFDYFTEAVVGKAHSSRGDYTASQDHNVTVTGISQDRFALGYLPLAYYEENKSKVKVLAVVGGEKSPKKNEGVLPNRETVESGTYFPLSRPIFIYINEAALNKDWVSQFVKFYLKQAPQIVLEVKYVPLPTKLYVLGNERLQKKKLGTVFGGHSKIGLKLEDLLSQEGSL
ncbi:PstS family phosphate ABC transporter substrate-binding protein [Bdellovibrio sp. NC01]|uniref:PstS family phosphate ABC transporter substrate-binding protein n=1 Tax=Bdellovibrio sp. NC01 TaxID=2220073 RepID=UPI00115AD001|nr:PstS family phosphate ABC transporter substrate-binding protein [Bdellovibrio sp. NC01]QDK37486.1 protein sphX [Bdellovibrio sp. NC01]